MIANPTVNFMPTAQDSGTRKRGAQPGNKNTLRFGLYSAKAKELTSTYGNSKTNLFRVALERAVIEHHGSPISLYQVALIQTATEAMRAAIANRELLAAAIAKGESPRPELRMAIDAAYMKHLDTRDRKLAELKIDGSARDAAQRSLPDFTLFAEPQADPPPSPQADAPSILTQPESPTIASDPPAQSG